MVSKMEERWKWKNFNVEERRTNYRRLRNELERTTEQAKRNTLRTHVQRLWNFIEKAVMI